MLSEGLIVTITGMVTVFSFLAILVLAMNIMAKVVVWVNKFMPEEVAAPAKAARPAATEDDVAVAIAVVKMGM